MPELSGAEPAVLTQEHLLTWVQESTGPDIKRTEARQGLAPELVELQILRDSGLPTVKVAKSRDLSETGIGLTCRERIGADELVEVKFHYDERCYVARARVIHCTQTIGGYKVGLRFVFE